MDGFLQRPTPLDLNPGVTAAAANTFPVGFYMNLNPDGTPKAVLDLPVIGALAQNYTTLDHYFCSSAGETFPNRLYQHAARTDRDHNNLTISKLPTIWDQLSPIPNNNGIPTGPYFQGPALPWALGPEVLPVLASVRPWRSQRDRCTGQDLVVPGYRRPGTADQCQLRRP
jgi:Phosphoesterase family